MKKYKMISLFSIITFILPQALHSNPEEDFWIAACYGDIEKIETLSHQEININLIIDRADLSPLMCASMNGFPETVKKLISLGADINQTNQFTQMTALHFAAREGQLQTVIELLSHGAQSLKNKDGETPFDIAIFYHSLYGEAGSWKEIIKILFNK